MSDSSKPQQRSGATPIKNPLLSASVTGLTFDDFPNKPQLLPAAPPIVHAPPPPAVTPSALLGREHKSLVTVGSSSLDTENLDEINLNASAEDSVSSDHHSDANANSLLEQPNSTSDSILSQAASSFSALPSVASNVFSSFSKRITAISSRETTPSNDAYDPNGNFVPQLDIQPNYTQQQHQHQQPQQQQQQPQYQFTAANQGPPPNEPFYAPPPPQAGSIYYGGLPPTSAGLAEQQPPINLPPAEPPKFYTPGEVSALPSAPPASVPPPSAGGQNNFRFGAKKKLYAPIPGLSDQQSPQAAAIFQPPAAVSAPLTFDNSSQGAYTASDPYGQPPAPAPYLNEERKSEERKTIGGGLFSKISNLAPTGVLQNITGLVQSAAGTLTQTINPNSQSLQSNEQGSAPTNFGITFDSQQSGGYFAGVPPPPAANYFADPNLGEQQQANYPPPPPATGEIFQGNPVAIQPPPPPAAAVTFFNPSEASGAQSTGEANFFNTAAAPAVFDPFNQPSPATEPHRPARPSSRPLNAFSETVSGATLPGFTGSQQPLRPPSVASRPPSQPGSSITPRPPSANEQTPVSLCTPLQTGISATPQVHQGLVTFFNPLQATSGSPPTLTTTSTPTQVGLFDPTKYTPNISTIPQPASLSPTPPQVGLFDPSKYLPNNSTLPPQAGVHSTPQPSQLPPTSGAALPPPAAGHTSYRLQKGTKLYKNPLTAQETAPVQVTPNPVFGVAPPQAAFPPTSFAGSPNVYAPASLPPTQADFQPFGQSIQASTVTSVPANIFVPPTEAQSVPLFAPPAATEQIPKVVEEQPTTNTSVPEQVQQPQEAPLFVPTQEEIPAPIANPLLLASQENTTTPIARTDLNNSSLLAPPAESETKTEENPECSNLFPPSISQPIKQEEAIHSAERVEEPQQTSNFPNSEYFFKPIEPVTEQFPLEAANQTVNFFGHNEESSQQFFKPIEAVVETAKLKKDNKNQDIPLTTTAEQSHPSVDALEQTLRNLNLENQATPAAVAEAPTTLAQLPPPPTQLGAGSGNPYRRGSATETHKPLGAPPTLANFFTPAPGATSGSGDFNFFATLPSSGESCNAASNFFSSSSLIPEENTQQFFNTPTTVTPAEASNQSQGLNFFAVAATPPTTVKETKPETAIATQSEETPSVQYLNTAEVGNSNEAPTQKPIAAEAPQTTPYPLEDYSQNTATPGTPLFPALPTNVGIIPSVTESLENINKHPVEETLQTPSIGFENFLTSTNQTQITSTNFFDSVAGNQQPPTTDPYSLDNTTTGIFTQLPTNIQTISSENKAEVFTGSQPGSETATTTTGLFPQLPVCIATNSTDNKATTLLENQAAVSASSQTSTPTPYPSVNAQTGLFPQLPQNIGIIPSVTESTEHIEQHQNEESTLATHVPPPIGFENFLQTPQLPAQTEHTPLIQETPTQTQQPTETTSLVNNFSNFFNQTTLQQPQLPNNTSSFFDNLAGQQPPPQQQLPQQPIARNSTAAANTTAVSNEDQIIQNFFNNPPPKDADHVGDLNYDLVHSGLAIRNLQQRSLTPVSNLVEPPSSACSEFSTLNASETSIIKEDNKAEDSAAAAVDSNNTAISKHYEELPEEILKELRMANVLQGDKAMAAPVAGTSYKPAVKHWFYKRTVDGKQIWAPFSHYDSALLETSLVMEGDDKPEIVAVEGGRYDVNISERRKRSVYWESEPIEVRRCSWFYKAVDSKYIPYEESTADVLEAEYKQAAESGVWHKTIILGMGEQVVFHGPTVIVHFQQQHNQDAWGGTTQTTTRPRVVKRDLDDFNIAQGESQKVDHLLFMVHGIGSACDLKLRSVEEVVEDFRSIAHQLVQSHYKNSADLGLVGRVEVLPISWHSHLHSIELGIDEKLRSITLESIPKLRNFTNDTLLDILFYTSPTFCQRIMNSIVVSLNDIYLKYRQRHPEFNGGVSLAGHSLGSLIIFDLLCHQNPIKESEEKNLENPDQQFLTTSTTTTTSATGQLENNQMEAKPISYTMGPAGTGQPFINYGQLIFQPKKFFAMGSPIGMFVTIRGIDKLGLDFRLPTCPGFYNIFHPYDPVAYRIEALVNPDLSGTRPVLIPHHKGRKRMHLELKETMARVSTDLKHRFLDKFKNTFESVNIFGPLAKSKKETEELMEKEVEKVIEMQMQLERQGNHQQSQSQTPSQDHLSPSDDQHQPLAAPTLNQPLRTRTDSVSTVVSDDMVEVDFPLGKLNDSKRIDYVLQEAPLEFINEYIFALSSHVCYWDSEDTILFVMKEIYSGLGISPDSQVPQQTMTIERPSSRNSLSGP